MQLVMQIVANGLLLGGIYALLAVGLTLIFGVLRVVNFAHADFMMLGMYGVYWLWALFGLDPYVSMFMVIPAVFLLGMLTSRFIIQRAIGAPEVTVVFSMLGLSILLQNGALTAWAADPRTVITAYTGTVFLLGTIRLSVPMTIAFLVALLLALLLWLFLTRTMYGKAIQAVAQNRQAAKLMGIHVNGVYIFTYAIAVAAAGATGALMSPVFTAHPRIGMSYSVIVFIIVVLGGLGSVPGSVIAALIMGIIQAGAGFLIGAAWAELVFFLIFLLVLILRPQGFFGRRGAEQYGAQ